MQDTHSALSKFLRRLKLRSDLSESEQSAILSLPCTVQQVRANYDIIHPGHETDHATLVAHGLAGRFDPMSNGRRQITALYIPGDMCDLHSVVSPVAGWGLTALSDTTLLKVPHADLRRIAIAQPAIAFAFWRDTTADASILSRWVGSIGKRGAAGRLAHLICEMATRLHVAGLQDRNGFELDMSQERLAEALGMTAVHVNRTFQSLRSRGVVRSIGRVIEIPCWERLSDLAEFDPTYLLLNRERSDLSSNRPARSPSPYFA